MQPSTPSPAPARREFRGQMKANKSYADRVAYWWVFTYPGSFAGAVVEIREAVSAGATYKTRRYAVTEMPGSGGARKFEYTKPFRDRKPDGSPDRYVVRFDHRTPARCGCNCEGFRNRLKCVHLDSLLCLVGPKSEGNRVSGPGTHKWEKRGSQSYRCAACGVRAYDPALMDTHPEARHCRAVSPAGGRPTVPGTDPTRRPPADPRRTPRPDPAAGRGKGSPRGVPARGKGKPHTPRKTPGKGR